MKIEVHFINPPYSHIETIDQEELDQLTGQLAQYPNNHLTFNNVDGDVVVVNFKLFPIVKVVVFPDTASDSTANFQINLPPLWMKTK